VPTLAVYRGDQFLRHVELDEAPLRIGRAPENELILEDRDKQVSRAHAVIKFERGRYVVYDLKSQNGVWMGDRRVKSDPLAVDVPVTIGPYRLRLLAEPMPTMAVPVEETYLSSSPPPQPEEHQPEPTEPAGPGAPSSQTHRGKPTAETQHGKAAAPSSSRKGLVIAAAAIVAVAAVGIVVVQVVRKSRTEPPVTTTTVPPGPTAEQRFQDHFNKAQEFIAKSEKESALAANKEALAALPDDPRGLKQRADIDAMPTPLVDPPLIPEGGTPPPNTAAVQPAAPGPTAPGTTPTPGTTATPTAPANSTLPPTLRVEGRSGEPASSRNTREKTAKTHLDDAKKALDDRRYPDAIAAAQQAMEVSGRTDFGTSPNEANSIVAKAKAAQTADESETRAANAQKLVAQAKALANSNNVLEALNRLREARMLSPQAVNQELESSLLDQARKLGEAALARAKFLDVNDNRREEALKEFERAAQFLDVLPGGHPGLSYAKQRVTDLKSGR
jgi:tetratricopeptide (TPR) repeat protein